MDLIFTVCSEALTLANSNEIVLLDDLIGSTNPRNSRNSNKIYERADILHNLRPKFARKPGGVKIAFVSYLFFLHVQRLRAILLVITKFSTCLHIIFFQPALVFIILFPFLRFSDRYYFCDLWVLPSRLLTYYTLQFELLFLLATSLSFKAGPG